MSNEARVIKMNELLNISSEIPHLNMPNSCIHNSLRHDEPSINSFSSVRAGSVTVTGKKLASHPNLSPTSLQKHVKLPIPLQTLSRIKKQNSQVKKILKKTSKNTTCVQPLSPKIKSKHKNEENSEKNKEKTINTKSSAREESPKSFMQNDSATPKYPLKLKHFSKKETKIKTSALVSGSKVKKNIEKQLMIDFEKMKNKTKTDVKSLTPRSSKTEPKKSQKLEKKKKDEILTDLKSSSKKIPIEITKILPKSKTRPRLSINGESSILSLNKRNSESMLKHPSKTKSKKKLKKAKKTENIFRDFKRKSTLESKRSEKFDFPKPPKFRPLQRDSNSSEIKKTLEFLMSEFDSEPSKVSEFPKHESQTNFFQSKAKENSAILIQSHIRKYLAQKKYKRVKDSYSIEDDEVKNIISGWKKDSNDLKKTASMNDFKLFNEGQLDSLQKLKAEEIYQIKSVIKNSSESAQVIDTITKIINSRYQNIAKIMQSKYENKHGLINDNGLLYRISEDSEVLEDFDRSGDSDSLKRHKNWSQTTETAANTKDNSVTPSKGDYRSQLSNDLWPVDPELVKIPLNPSPNTCKVISSDSISQISEKILKLFLEEELEKYLKPSQQAKNPEPVQHFDYFIELGIDFILKRFEKIDKSLARPLRKNPLEVLAMVQSPYTVNPLKWFSFPSIFPPEFLEEFSKVLASQDPTVDRNQIKMFFDCCNEIIQSLRPFATNGAPMPWSANKKVLRVKKVEKSEVKRFLTQKIEVLNSVGAGKIPDLDFFTGDKVNEEKLHRCREEKIGVLIAQDIKTNEKTWVDYEFEETQARLLVADKILDLIVTETAGIMGN